jgi:YcxB-like protein
MPVTAKFKMTADEFMEGQRVFNRFLAPPIARFNYRFATPVGCLLLAEGILGFVLKWNWGLCLFFVIFGGYLASCKVLFGRRMLKKEFAQYPELANEKCMEFGEEKIFVQTSHGKGETVWARFSRFIETNQIIVLFAPPRLFHTIPKRVLSSDELAELQDLLRRKLPGK